LKNTKLIKSISPGLAHLTFLLKEIGYLEPMLNYLSILLIKGLILIISTKNQPMDKNTNAPLLFMQFVMKVKIVQILNLYLKPSL